MIFPRLLQVDNYQPTLWNFAVDRDAWTHWLEMFRQHFASLDRLLDGPNDPRRSILHEVGIRLFATLESRDSLAKHSHPHAWTMVRDGLLRHHNLPDLYRAVKQRENVRAIQSLPAVLAKLDQTTDRTLRRRRIIAGILAGNLFDLGSPATIGHCHDKLVDKIDEVLARHWLYDHSTELSTHIDTLRTASRVVILVDNSGPDFVCGVVPLVLELVKSDVAVVLAGNELPSLNDLTAAEMSPVLQEIAQTLGSAGGSLTSAQVEVVSTGTGEPGIDLRNVSAALAQAVAPCALLIIVGQGRALETNWEAEFDVPTLRVSTIKDQLVAKRLGGRLFDCVCELRLPAQTKRA